ncbi:MAG: stage 0 sporulation protein [Bacilli bacterium]|nr:stage 0 sporulation protein [Bacilli bacterium]
MIEKENSINSIDNSEYRQYVGVRFYNTQRTYYFGIKEDLEVKEGDKVIVETIRGLELGEIAFAPIDIDKYESELGLKPIIRLANDIDVKIFESNKKDAASALEISKNEANRLKLDMNFISCEYTLDKTKVILTYVADERVDFRELLKSLASRLHTRIELRQVGSRDKAKMIGGVGICGLPLCCSTFLNEFDGISINRAKNQMLAINIPKLSGHCGKLICCLKYEDDAYSEEKKNFPELGTKLFIDKTEYTVTGVNVISKVVKIENQEDVKFLPIEELNKQARWRKNRNEEK